MNDLAAFREKTERNKRVQARYDELILEGKRGHYETICRVIHEEVDRERERCVKELGLLR